MCQNHVAIKILAHLAIDCQQTVTYYREAKVQLLTDSNYLTKDQQPTLQSVCKEFSVCYDEKDCLSRKVNGMFLKEDVREFFLRNNGYSTPNNDIPVIYKQKISIDHIQGKLLGCQNIKRNDISHKDWGVHFYKWDKDIDRFYNNADRYIEKLKQYLFVLTPDYSMFSCMNSNVQRFNLFRNRWCGNYWQRQGLSVIPAVGWSDERSFDYCFDGIEKGSIVAVSTIGTKRKAKETFLHGFFAMIASIKPEAVLCYGDVYREMQEVCHIIPCLYDCQIKDIEEAFEKLLYSEESLFSSKGVYQ